MKLRKMVAGIILAATMALVCSQETVFANATSTMTNEFIAKMLTEFTLDDLIEYGFENDIYVDSVRDGGHYLAEFSCQDPNNLKTDKVLESATNNIEEGNLDAFLDGFSKSIEKNQNGEGSILKALGSGAVEMGKNMVGNAGKNALKETANVMVEEVEGKYKDHFVFYYSRYFDVPSYMIKYVPVENNEDYVENIRRKYKCLNKVGLYEIEGEQMNVVLMASEECTIHDETGEYYITYYIPEDRFSDVARELFY